MTKRIAWTDPTTGNLCICHPAPGVIAEEEAIKVVPHGVTYKILDLTDFPLRDGYDGRDTHNENGEPHIDDFFRPALALDGDKVVIDLEKARQCAHQIRRAQREAEFEPFDKIVAAAIPGKVEAAEAERAKIREHHELVQDMVDAADTVSELKDAILLKVGLE